MTSLSLMRLRIILQSFIHCVELRELTMNSRELIINTIFLLEKNQNTESTNRTELFRLFCGFRVQKVFMEN